MYGRRACTAFCLVLLSLPAGRAGAQPLGEGAASTRRSLVNLAHLNHLFEAVRLNGENAGIVHIYAEAPDYAWIGDADEGIACVDDAARAAVLYLRHFSSTGDRASLKRARLLLNFILHMQAPNALFYNFIWPDFTIHRDGPTTSASLGWWTARAVWALGEGANVFRRIDPPFAGTLEASARKTYSHLDTLLAPYGKIERHAGYPVPQWLLYRSAGDATSVLMLGLIALARPGPDTRTEAYLMKFAAGLLRMQQGDATHFPYGAFLSWKNVWHGWGNSQAYALLQAGALLRKAGYRAAAKTEVMYFYPYVAAQGFFREIAFGPLDARDKYEIEPFPQIAYNIRPMVLAAVTLFRQTGEMEYAGTAARYGSWFFGNNVMQTPIYDPDTGRCFDGIESAEKINRNAGAESTIEALLVMLAIEEAPAVRAALQPYLHDQQHP